MYYVRMWTEFFVTHDKEDWQDGVNTGVGFWDQ
jgi:hypothetical protein